MGALFGNVGHREVRTPPSSPNGGEGGAGEAGDGWGAPLGSLRCQLYRLASPSSANQSNGLSDRLTMTFWMSV